MNKKYEAIIFDLDDTLYDYSYYHQKSLDKTLILISKNFKIEIYVLKKKYSEISKNLKLKLGNVSSSHNKFIYFHHLFRFYGLKMSELKFYFSFYWNSFLNNIKLYNDARETLKILKKKTNLYLLTDYNSNETFQKLSKLNISSFFKDIITSEEIGSEKPSKDNFQYIYDVIKFRCKQKILVIGNDLNKDVKGSLNFGFCSIYFSKNYRDFEYKNGYYIFGKYKSILNNLDTIL